MLYPGTRILAHARARTRAHTHTLQDVATIIIPILQRSKLRFREGTWRGKRLKVRKGSRS